jgi:SAM-dependent methyltransferase
MEPGELSIGNSSKGFDSRALDPVSKQFDSIASLYRQFRPVFMDEMYEDMMRLTGVRPGDDVLEIGLGTGQATRPLATRGLHIVGVEQGPHLLEQARIHLTGVDKYVELINTSFEQFEPPRDRKFKIVLAAEGFHWLDPRLRFSKTAQALKTGGFLVLMDWTHVLGGTDLKASNEILREVHEEVILRYDPRELDAQRPFDLKSPAMYPEQKEELKSELFTPFQVRRYFSRQRLTANGYRKLLNTHSNFLRMDEPTRVKALDEVERIVARRGGSVTRQLMAELRVAMKRER